MACLPLALGVRSFLQDRTGVVNVGQGTNTGTSPLFYGLKVGISCEVLSTTYVWCHNLRCKIKIKIKKLTWVFGYRYISMNTTAPYYCWLPCCCTCALQVKSNLTQSSEPTVGPHAFVVIQFNSSIPASLSIDLPYSIRVGIAAEFGQGAHFADVCRVVCFQEGTTWIQEFLSALINSNNTSQLHSNDLVLPVTVSVRLDAVTLRWTQSGEALATYLPVHALTYSQTHEVNT
jgi:hypothetical protein